MSNHAGSYMLNSVLNSAAELGIFEKIGKEDTRAFLKKIFGIGSHYDCNPGEILEDIAEDYDVCYCCLKFDRPMQNGLCNECESF